MRLLYVMAGVLVALASAEPLRSAEPAAGQWRSLFNGHDLEGWQPKIKGHQLGENFASTFRVEDGILKVAYDEYGDFENRFGHLFFEEKFSSYILRVEYRFVGDQVPGGPSWAFRNSGIMFHCQPPETMSVDQEFPVSIEAQMLGGNGRTERTTGNVCSPGTHIVMNGQLVTRHCNSSTSKTYHGDQWVTLEIEVHGAGKVIHRINGETVLEYEQPQLDENDENAKPLIRDGQKLVHDGYIALQAESHPVQFRKVEIQVLEE
jgi:hypothetical protein